MLGHVANRNHRLIAEAKRYDSFRHTLDVMTLRRIGGCERAETTSRESRRYEKGAGGGYCSRGRNGNAHVAPNPTTPHVVNADRSKP
jgi:hypothetical protein